MMRSPHGPSGQPNGAGPPNPPRSHLALLLGGGAFIIAVIVVLVGWAILQGREEAHRTAEIATSNLSETLADNFKSALDKIDLSLQSIRDEVYRQQRTGHWDDQDIIAAIARQDERHPDTLGFRIFGPDGRLRFGIKNIADSNANIADRDDFKYLRDTPGSGLMVSPPLFGSVARQRLIVVARRITNRDGSFGGVVYGPLSIQRLTNELADLNLGTGGIVALHHAGFLMAARFPEIQGPGNSFIPIPANDPLRGIIASGAPITQYDYVSPLDGARRTATIRRIEGQSYYVLVGLSEADYLADWRRNSIHLLLFGAVMIGVVLVGMLILHKHISDWKRATANLAEKTELLLQSNADLEQFAYVASHDLQTPLRNIVSYAQLLDRRYKARLDADADDFIGFIVDNGTRMTRLINDLLEYSRITDHSKRLDPTSAGEAVAKALANLKTDLEECGAAVELGELPRVMAEPSQLIRLFQNLLGNGLRYRAPDRPLRLAVTAQRIGPDHWRFAVADNGIGIAPEYHDKIFEIFQRLDPSWGQDGTGIGLTLCRRIVHRFGGAIWLDSAPNVGTTVFFTLRDGSAAT